MSPETRIRRLETLTEAETENGPQIVIYQRGDRPHDPPKDGRVRIFIPDNGHGPE
jgi:hypothetical protein